MPLEAAVRGPARDGDVDRFALSPVRARIHLAWAPWTDLATGIGQLLAELAASTPPAPPEPEPPAEPSGRELVDGVPGADDTALHDTGVDPPQMELPTDG